MMDYIVNLLRSIWNAIKKIFRKILNFFNDIVDWFRAKIHKYIDKPYIKAVAVRIDDALKNGNYRIVKCFYDTKKGKIIDEDLEGIEAEQLDDYAQDIFKDKPVVILE
ncbi:hypothetical protein [Aquifex sp.]